jgi:hypothetical protein
MVNGLQSKVEKTKANAETLRTQRSAEKRNRGFFGRERF